MVVTLSPELEDLVREMVETGLYRDATEVVAEALRRLDREQSSPARDQALRAAVQEGFDAIASGDFSRVTTPEELKALFKEQ
jgi:antitoxin ParD1/3/4